jgi:hypothetical protein
MAPAVGASAPQGAISTQLDRVQNDKPTASEPPRPTTAEAAPPPPPPDSGRGAHLDTTA